MRIPVSTGRVSSREADRATCRAVSTKAWVGSVMRVSGAGPGSVGKSSERSVRSWNLAEPEITSTSCSWERSSIVTVSPGSERATSSSEPRREHGDAGLEATSAWSGTRSPTSMSVASSSARSPSAESMTPERACTMRASEATRVAVCSWASSSAVERESFTYAPRGSIA